MAPTKIDQGTLIILDIGRNVADSREKTEKSFFEKARECTGRIIESKILTQGKNLIGIILLGSKKSDSEFKHIEISVGLQIPAWQMIRDLPETPSKYKGSWFDSLLVAAQLFRDETNVNILNKKIMLMTNFEVSSHLEDEEVEPVLNGFTEEGIEVNVIGPDLYADEHKHSDIMFARQFVETTKGASATFEYTMQYLLFHKKKAVHSRPWNVDLSIGPNIKIPVSSYIRTKDEPLIKKWLKAVKDPVTNTASTSEGIVKNKVHINTENQKPVEQSDIIKGYHYGGQYIPLNKYEKDMLYDSGPKCLSVYGFTNSDNISWQTLNGDGLSLIFGRKGDKKAQQAVQCLVECLHELKLVAIVRRVYNHGFAPKMCVLMPLMDTNNYVCLSMIKIPFKEDLKLMAFPPTNLKQYDCTRDQVDAFKDLIRAMDLTKAYDESEFDDTEAFPTAEMVNPSAQYVLDCIAFRGLNPGKPLPPPRDDILKLFKLPPLIENRSLEPLERIKNLFVLNKVEHKKREQKMQVTLEDPVDDGNASHLDDPMSDCVPKIQLNINKKTDDIKKIGTIDPIDDFCTLKKKGQKPSDLFVQISSVIEHMFYNNLDGNYSKVLNTLSFMRKECVEDNPMYYNDWLHKFKIELETCNKKYILEMIDEKNLNLILDTENNLSTYKYDAMECDSKLYENDTEPALTGVTISSEVHDLFDNM